MFDTLICHLNKANYLTFFHLQAVLHFVNQNMSTMGLQVADMDRQVKNKKQLNTV